MLEQHPSNELDKSHQWHAHRPKWSIDLLRLNKVLHFITLAEAMDLKVEVSVNDLGPSWRLGLLLATLDLLGNRLLLLLGLLVFRLACLFCELGGLLRCPSPSYFALDCPCLPVCSTGGRRCGHRVSKKALARWVGV